MEWHGYFGLESFRLLGGVHIPPCWEIQLTLCEMLTLPHDFYQSIVRENDRPSSKIVIKPPIKPSNSKLNVSLSTPSITRSARQTLRSEKKQPTALRHMRNRRPSQIPNYHSTVLPTFVSSFVPSPRIAEENEIR